MSRKRGSGPLDATRIGRVVIRESFHIGVRTLVLAGVEIGPRAIVGGNSVVSSTLPPDTVCAGAPARVICSLDEYLDRHLAALTRLPTFDYLRYDIRFATPERREEMVRAVATGDAYITGGRSAELQGSGGTPRTPQAQDE